MSNIAFLSCGLLSLIMFLNIDMWFVLKPEIRKAIMIAIALVNFVYFILFKKYDKVILYKKDVSALSLLYPAISIISFSIAQWMKTSV